MEKTDRILARLRLSKISVWRVLGPAFYLRPATQKYRILCVCVFYLRPATQKCRIICVWGGEVLPEPRNPEIQDSVHDPNLKNVIAQIWKHHPKARHNIPPSSLDGGRDREGAVSANVVAV